MMSKNTIPKVLVVAGPNGSGKSTVTSKLPTCGIYINTDDIKKRQGCSDIEAAIAAETLREQCVELKLDFTFETVLSTERNLNLLKRAKESGYHIESIFVLTSDENINVDRVCYRFVTGGHDVPEEKIRSRFKKSLTNLPELINLSDVCTVIDNTQCYETIFEKVNESFEIYENQFWSYNEIAKLTGII